MAQSGPSAKNAVVSAAKKRYYFAMKAYHPASGPNRPELSMTSMIDVIFLLLIFFVFTANFNELEELLPMNLTLPGSAEQKEAKTPEELDLGEIRIHVGRTTGPNGKNDIDSDRAFRWRVNRRECAAPEELAAAIQRLAAISRTVPVVITPESDVPIERVLDIYDLCRRAGLARVQFAVKRPKGAG